MSELSAKYGITTNQVESWLNWGKAALKDKLLTEVNFYSRSEDEQAEELVSMLGALGFA